ELQIIVYFRSTPQPRRVNELEGMVVIPQVGVYRIARGACFGGDDVPLFPEEPVDQRRLAGVGAPDHRHLNGLAFLSRLPGRELLHENVQQVAGALPHSGRYSDRIAEPERVEVVLRSGALQVVELVDG